LIDELRRGPFRADAIFDRHREPLAPGTTRIAAPARTNP